MIQKDLFDENIKTKYIASFYWAMTTICTVGYGDISAFTIEERAFSIIYMFFAGAVFTYTLGTVGDIVDNIYLDDTDHEENMTKLNKYMEEKKIPLKLQAKVKQYMNYNHNTQKQEGKHDLLLLDLLTKKLREDLKMHIYKNVLLWCDFFRNFSDDFIIKLCQTMKEMTFAPSQVIFKKGQLNPNLFFIVKRECLIQSYRLLLIQKGSFIGFEQFICGNKAKFKAISKGYSSSFILKREKFIEVLKKFPEDYEKFNMIKDKVLNEEDYRLLNYKCIVCNQQGHFKSDCQKEKPKLLQIEFSQFSSITTKLFQKSFKRPNRRKLKILQSLNLLQRNVNKLCRINSNEINLIIDLIHPEQDRKEFQKQSRTQIHQIKHLEIKKKKPNTSLLLLKQNKKYIYEEEDNEVQNSELDEIETMMKQLMSSQNFVLKKIKCLENEEIDKQKNKQPQEKIRYEKFHIFQTYFNVYNVKKFLGIFNKCNYFLRICFEQKGKKHHDFSKYKSLNVILKSYTCPKQYIQTIRNKKFYGKFQTFTIAELLEQFIWYKSMYNFESFFEDFPFITGYRFFKNIHLTSKIRKMILRNRLRMKKKSKNFKKIIKSKKSKQKQVIKAKSFEDVVSDFKFLKKPIKKTSLQVKKNPFIKDKIKKDGKIELKVHTQLDMKADQKIDQKTNTKSNIKEEKKINSKIILKVDKKSDINTNNQIT